MNILREIGMISRCTQSISDVYFKKLSLQKGQFLYLIRLYERPGINHQCLADIMKIDKSTVTKAMKKLFDEGYIIKEKDANDKRNLKLSLSKKSEAIIHKLIGFEENILKLSTINLDKKEQELLLKLNNKVRLNIEKIWKNHRYEINEILDISIIEVNSQEDIDKCFEIRKEVFQKEQHVSSHIDFDDKDNDAYHFLALYNNKAVGTMRLRKYDLKIIKLERLSILSKYRNLGIGSKFIKEIESFCIKNEINALVLNSQLQASNFYKRLGYTEYGEIFTEANIKHIMMKKILP